MKLQPKHYYPLFLNLTGQTALVLGGDVVAEAKVRPLLAAGANIRLVANQVSHSLAAILEKTDAEILTGKFVSTHLDGVQLAIDCGGAPSCSAALRRAAKARGVLLNCVDAETQADFISPATLTRGPLQVAISTGGAAPLFARNLRQMLDVLLPASLGAVLTAVGGFRAKVKAILPSGKRKAFWEAIFDHKTLETLQGLPENELQSALEGHLSAAQNGAPAGAIGTVTLIGAGPGHAELITLAGLKALQQADVVLYDALVDPAMIGYARRDAQFIPVGKRCGKQSASQGFINRTLANMAKQGKNIARLKCGDPFVFGRGGEEIEFLEAQSVPVVVVPGVTAASAAAADVKLPLTHRGVARRLTFMTGTTADALPDDKPDWQALLTGGTVAIYMAKKSLARTLADIQLAGFGAGLPAVWVANAGRPDKKIVHSTVGTLSADITALHTEAPSLVLIGEAMATATGKNLLADAQGQVEQAAI